MSPRSFVTVIAAALMLYAGASLLAKPKAQDLYTCCSSQDDCGGVVCCDAESLGMVPCDSDLTGYCMTTCRRPN